MLERKTQVKLIKYEIEHIRYFSDLEDGLQKILGEVVYTPKVPCNDFELLYMILDDMGIPPDSGKEPRDIFNYLYSQLYWKKGKITDKDINNFLDRCLEHSK